MKNEIEAMITDITTTTTEAEDYTGEDGLLYCGKCHTPKEAYFAEGKTCFGRDRHPTDCDCQRAAREKQQAAESRQKHLEKVEDLKRRAPPRNCRTLAANRASPASSSITPSAVYSAERQIPSVRPAEGSKQA